jgi:hypothetical protein
MIKTFTVDNSEIFETNKKLSNRFSCTHSVFSRIVNGPMSIVPVFCLYVNRMVYVRLIEIKMTRMIE